MLTQAIRLLRSIRWFGGGLAQSRIVVCAVGSLQGDAREELEALGAETRIVSRFHPANPTGNRHQLLSELLVAPEQLLFLLDCDTIVVQDPLPYLRTDAFQGKVAPTPTVSDEVFERLFAHFHLVKPPRTHLARLSGTLMIPYFNAGVLAIPRALAQILAPVWRKYNEILADEPHLVAPCQRHMHQASLSLALAATGIPCAELPEELNFQINAQQVAQPPGFAESDPVIVHYHHLATDDGFLLPCPYPGTQARIEQFHERLRAEGIAEAHQAAETRSSRPVVVLGMHRSGTSVVTELLTTLGMYVGTPGELTPADMFNPTGYWEYREAVKIDTEIMEALSASWTDNIAGADVSRLSVEQYAAFLARAREVVRSLGGHGTFLLKDPRMSLLFPLWRRVLESPVCVIAWREPLAVARSLWTRDRQPLLVSLALWEHYNRTLLRDSAGLARLLVSYDELLADPERIAGELHASLTALGVPGLQLPGAERIGQTVNADFNRSGPRARTEESLLDPGQHELLAALRSGAALHEPVAPTPARTLELLAEFATFETRQEALLADVAELDDLLRAVFKSRSWRVGHSATMFVQRLRRTSAITALDRWRQSKRRRLETPD
ncbi:MAG: putative glycosyltransferase [Acidobacteria bacterium]|nr:putative glycosyltransferase [Acidobacteriota bacterium]